ncbi:hypothetical protein D4764_06G0000610 [Takifugu flavidus]|uniref:Uncharacterized protein n=1 Tax=Takifugu flavidus TaxID=433684 RepID=A0A5C6MWN2_9TELE|nr:hypothetical protein D4764_06G0000610 [Takifugu flavidus]
MFAVHVLLLFSLAHLSHSALQTCGDLLRPLNQLHPRSLEGDWALVAGSVSQLSLMEPFSQRESATASFSNNTDSSTITLKRSMRSKNNCYYQSYNISLEGSSFTFDNGRVNATFVHASCPDCILISFNVESGKRIHFYLFSRRRQLEEKEMEEFRRQVGCLKMPPPVVMDPANELCPEEGTSEAAVE